MEKYYLVKAEDIPQDYDENGFAMSELLTGSYNGGIKNYKCFLKAGSQVSPKLYKEETVLLMFGKGRGCIASEKEMYNITELSFYVPDFDKEPYTIHAMEDMEFILSVVEMNQWDKELYEASHVHLPFFIPVSDAVKYDQDCKGPNTTSWHILSPKMLGRIMVGVVRAVGEGTTEAGHPKVHQWNYCVGNSDFNLTVDDCPTVSHKAGDWSFIPAGPGHALVAEPGKEVYYVWYEHYTREKDFCITLARGEEFHGAV